MNKPSSSYKPAPSHHNHIVSESNNSHHKPLTKHTSSTTSKKKPRHSTSDQAKLLDSEPNEIKLNSHLSTQPIPTQLVPIQKFSFFKWEINVDTLVRLFIVA